MSKAIKIMLVISLTSTFLVGCSKDKSKSKTTNTSTTQAKKKSSRSKVSTKSSVNRSESKKDEPEKSQKEIVKYSKKEDEGTIKVILTGKEGLCVHIEKIVQLPISQLEDGADSVDDVKKELEERKQQMDSLHLKGFTVQVEIQQSQVMIKTQTDFSDYSSEDFARLREADVSFDNGDSQTIDEDRLYSMDECKTKYEAAGFQKVNG